MPAYAGAATPAVTPGTSSNGTPAAASASASSPPRPNTNGSPPLRRTTRLPARPELDEQRVRLLLGERRRAGLLAHVAQLRLWPRARRARRAGSGGRRGSRRRSRSARASGGSSGRGRRAPRPRGRRCRSRARTLSGGHQRSASASNSSAPAASRRSRHRGADAAGSPCIALELVADPVRAVGQPDEGGDLMRVSSLVTACAPIGVWQRGLERRTSARSAVRQASAS